MKVTTIPDKFNFFSSFFCVLIVSVNSHDAITIINLGQSDDPNAINRGELTPLITKSSATNFKLTPRFTVYDYGECM